MVSDLKSIPVVFSLILFFLICGNAEELLVQRFDLSSYTPGSWTATEIKYDVR